MSLGSLSAVLKKVPDSRTRGESLGNLAKCLGDRDLPYTARLGYVQGVADFLMLLGAIEITQDDTVAHIKARSEVALYLLRSLASHSESGLSLLSSWDEKGVDQSASGYEAVGRAVNFVHALEQHRQRELDSPEPIRSQQVAQVVIKRHSPRDPLGCYLVQYDRSAGHYQFIGGRFRESDGDLRGTMIRELGEELKLKLRYGRDFGLDVLAEDVSFTSHSTTFGVLTQYTANYYHLRDLVVNIPDNQDNRWVSFRELRQRVADDERSIASDVILEQPIDWQALPTSFREV